MTRMSRYSVLQTEKLWVRGRKLIVNKKKLGGIYPSIEKFEVKLYLLQCLSKVWSVWKTLSSIASWDLLNILLLPFHFVQLKLWEAIYPFCMLLDILRINGFNRSCNKQIQSNFYIHQHISLNWGKNKHCHIIIFIIQFFF